MKERAVSRVAREPGWWGARFVVTSEARAGGSELSIRPRLELSTSMDERRVGPMKWHLPVLV